MENPKRAPYPMRYALFYANARPTERSWRSVVIGRRVRGERDPDRLLPAGPAAGVSSFEVARQILDRFRSTVESLTAPDLNDEVVSKIGERILGEGKAETKKYLFDARSRRFYRAWGTASDSFSEALYANLGLALEQCDVDSIRHCSECKRFFYDGSKRSTAYCSARCRKRGTIRAYRQRNPEGYREYQRKLMARRRTEGKAT